MIWATSWVQIKTHPCFSFLELAFSCIGKQSHSPPIAISLVLTSGGQQDSGQGEEGRPKFPCQGQSRMGLVHLDLGNALMDTAPCG